MPRLILLCGLPASGKTTLARRLATSLPAVRLCPDDWLTALNFSLFDQDARANLEALFWHHAQDLLRLGQSVILENGFWSRTERDNIRHTARYLGASVELHYLAVPLDELAKRLAARHRAGGIEITSDLLHQYARTFEPPTPTELALYDNPPTNP